MNEILLAWFSHLEGTGGQDRENEAILEIAAVQIVEGKVKEDYYHTLIHSERKIPKRPWITFTNEDLKHAPSFDEIRDELFSYLNQSVLVAHHARVDWRLLKRKYLQYHPVLLDTLTLSRKLYANEKKHSLDDLSDRLYLTDIHKIFLIPLKDTVLTTMLGSQLMRLLQCARKDSRLKRHYWNYIDCVELRPSLMNKGIFLIHFTKGDVCESDDGCYQSGGSTSSQNRASGR